VLLAALMFLMPQGIVGTLGVLYGRLSTRPHTRESGKWPNPSAALASALGAGKPPRDVAIEAEGLTLRFGGLTAVDNVRLKIDAGAVHALIGPNGAGKSSVLNLISGFYTPTSGHISFFGETIAGRLSHDLARLGIARTFQNTELFGQMTVLENVLVAVDLHNRCTLAETLLRMPRFGREERAGLAQAQGLLNFVGLSDYADEEARNLPFGHQRRLEIARALALRPKLLLLDEPAAGLTHGEIEDLKALIRLLATSGVTVILVEHHVEMVMTVSDHVTVLDYGSVIASGTAAQVQNDPQVIEAYFGSGQFALKRSAPAVHRGAAE
jgi:ABC-type branched-subunit amino acid transport system ATPase component